MTTTPIQNSSSVLTPPPAPAGKKPLVDIHGLRASGVFPENRVPCVNTLRIWTRDRRIPSHKMGHFVWYDVDEVEKHLRVKLLIPAR